MNLASWSWWSSAIPQGQLATTFALLYRVTRWHFWRLWKVLNGSPMFSLRSCSWPGGWGLLRSTSLPEASWRILMTRQRLLLSLVSTQNGIYYYMRSLRAMQSVSLIDSAIYIPSAIRSIWIHPTDRATSMSSFSVVSLSCILVLPSEHICSFWWNNTV